MNTDQSSVHSGGRCENVVECAAEQVFTSEGGHVTNCADEGGHAGSGETKLLQELGIRYDGRTYCFLSYRYSRLQDAVAYARLVRSRASLDMPEDQVTPPTGCEETVAPTRAEAEEMARLGVDRRNGRYAFAEFEYDKLSDALAYARLMTRDQASAAGGERHERASISHPKS